MRFWALALLISAPLQAATLTVSVSNFTTEVGELNIAVYDNKDDWLKEGTVAQQALRVEERLEDGLVVVTFELEPGEYAVSVSHDANDNGKMDTNFIGIPKEPVGLSNGHVPKFGPPNYKKAAFTLGEDGLEMPIKLLD